jgi:ABC-type sulfate/molybdate transport systems ATPase subunit
LKLEKIHIEINKAEIIHSLDLSINAGEIFVLMGPSGSGKTTLLKGIAGLIPLTRGRLVWEKGKGTTGLVFQEPRLFPHLTVQENIGFGLKMKGIPAKERRTQVQEFLTYLQLDGLENRYPHQLSGGQQQRVALGRTLILKPDLLLLDEPFASLDTSLRLDLIEWLYKLQRKHSFSILWVTHYLDETFAVADRVGVMLEGELVQAGVPAELFQQPASEKVAQFLSLPNRFSKDQWSRWFNGEFALPQLLNRGWIDPGQLQLIDVDSSFNENESACILSGMIKKVRPSRDGFSIIVAVDTAELEATRTGWERIPVVSEKVKVRVPVDRIHWYFA